MLAVSTLTLLCSALARESHDGRSAEGDDAHAWMVQRAVLVRQDALAGEVGVQQHVVWCLPLPKDFCLLFQAPEQRLQPAATRHTLVSACHLLCALCTCSTVPLRHGGHAPPWYGRLQQHSMPLMHLTSVIEQTSTRNLHQSRCAG